MKARFAINIPFAMAVLIGSVSAVHAQGLTRDQVRAELREAIRTGDILVGGEHGMTAYEMAPHRYPARPPVVGKTREQVRAELVEAVRTGDILVSGDSGLTAYEVAPHRYPARPAVAGKTRAQVREELELAIRLGDAPIDSKGRTPAERFPERFASVRAEHRLAMNTGAASQHAN